MRSYKPVGNSEGDSSPSLSWKASCQMGNISLFMSMENNLLNADLESGNYS